MSLPKIGSKTSLAQKAYEVIREAIIMNRFKPGDILSEERLAEELAISRTPVRSALKRLAFEHLIILNPSKNIVVSNVSHNDIKDISFVRMALEGSAVSILANTITEHQLNELKKIVSLQKEAVETNDYELFIKMEYDFHVLIANFTNNKWILEMVTNVNTIIQRYLILSGSLKKYAKVAITEHEKIMNELKNGNSMEAEKNMRDHINNVNNRMLK